MKYTPTGRLWAASSCLLIAPAFCFGVDVLQNPGFESGSSSWSGISAQSSNVYAGSQAGQLNQTFYWKQASQTIDCEPGQIVSFGGYLACEDIVEAAAGIRLKFYDSSNQSIATVAAGGVSGTTGYTFVEEPGYLVPSGTDYAKLQLYVGQSGTTYGTAYFDDLYVDVFSHKEVVVNSNGGFENGFAGWNQNHASLVSGSDAYEGSYASSISHGSYWKHSNYEFACDPAKEYAVSFAAATDSATTNGIYQIRYYDASNSQIAADHLLSLNGTNSYSTYYADGIYPPSGATTAKFYFAATYPGSGASYLDDVLITTDASGLAPSSLIDQDLTNLMTDPGFESGLGHWNGGVSADATEYAEGSQSGRFNGASFYKTYKSDQFAATEGKYYSMSVLASTLNVSVSPSITFSFFASDGTTKLGGSGAIADIEGTSPFREYSSDYVLAPTGTAYIEVKVSFPKENSGARLWLDELYVYESGNLPVRLVPTYESVSVYVSQESQATDEVAHIYYREVGETEWNEAFEPVYDSSRGEYRGSIVGLEEDQDYEVQVVLEANGTVLDEAGSTVTTWDSTPTISQTHTVASLYSSGQLLIEDMHGSPDGWIKITGTGSGDIDGGYSNDVALLIKNSSYIIFENIEIEGGRRHAVQVNMSDQIRLVNCEMSGWARQPNYTDGTYFYETEAELNSGNDNQAINKDAAVHLYKSRRTTVERCYMHDPRTTANNWEGSNHPAGPNAIYVQNVDGNFGHKLRGNFVVRYNDMIGSDEIRWNDVIEGENNNSDFGSFYRDTDVYGNMLAFANDDSTELDGGQMNTRFYGNRIESCYVALSLAPCRVGPSYVFRNLMYNSGDDRGSCYSVVKLGGGPTHSLGKSFFFHNTIYSGGNGITGVGFGNDGSSRDMFLAMTRNNIIRTLYSSPDYSRTIADDEENPWNSFDYDNLSTNGWSSANVEYASGQEPNGILDNPPTFVDASAGDFRLTSSSSGVDDGTALFNFADQYAGDAPDQGAIEHGDSSLFPIRPINISADQYFIELTGAAGGSTTPVDVVLTTGALGGTLDYEIRMNDTVDWLSVTPSTGTLSSSSTKTLTFTLQTSGLTSGDKLEATILVKLENGYSVPITVNADVQ